MNKLTLYLTIAAFFLAALITAAPGINRQIDLINTPVANTIVVSPTVNETPKTVSSAEELKELIAYDLFATRHFYYRSVDVYSQSSELSKLAMDNARNGTNSIKLVGDNATDAHYAYNLYSQSKSVGYGRSADEIKVTSALMSWRGQPGSYGIAVYQNGNQYNVSVALLSHHPDESVTDKNGAYAVRKVPDTISYLWADTVG